MAFAGYVKAAGVYQRPADRSVFREHAQNPERRLNAFMGWVKPAGGGEFFMSSNCVNFHKTTQVVTARPSDLLVFADTAPNWLWHSTFGIAMSAMYYQFPSTEHNRGGVLSYADGHVDWRPWRDAYTQEMARSEFVTHLDWAFASYSDLQWLRDHATVPK